MSEDKKVEETEPVECEDKASVHLETWPLSTKLMKMSEVVDSYRVVPRILLFATGYLVWVVTNWFMTLKEPTTEQSALIVTLTAIIPAVIGLYQNSARFKEGKRE